MKYEPNKAGPVVLVVDLDFLLFAYFFAFSEGMSGAFYRWNDPWFLFRDTALDG